MNHALLATSLPFDVELDSLLLANTLSAWLDHEILAKAPRRPRMTTPKSPSSTTTGSPMSTSVNQTPGQVLHHQESTERQYGLREKAQELGWCEASIRTLDRDLGKAGEPMAMARREDFKTLVADVSMGLRIEKSPGEGHAGSDRNAIRGAFGG